MASGSNSTVITNPNGGKFNLLISWNENSTSVSDNTSNITVTAKLTKNNSRFQVNNAGVLRAYWHDDRTNSDTEFASLAVTELGYNSTERVASGTRNITHKDDGTLNGYAYASWTRNSTYGGYVPVSGTCSTGWAGLTTIARASQPSINTYPNNSPNFNIGDTITIHMNRKSSSFTHTVKINYGSTSYTIATGVTDNCSFDTSKIASQLYAQIPSGTSYSNTISVTTYNGSTNIGTKTCAYTAKAVEANVKPTFSDFTFRDGNSTTTAITGNDQYIIQNKSSLVAEISTTNKAVARMSATMSSYVFEIGSYSGTENYSTSAITKTIGAINATKNQNLKITARDSRGYSTAVSKTVNIVPYSSPVVNASATRQNNFENNTTIKVSGSASLLKVNNVVKNAVNATNGVQYRYKDASTSTWGSWTNIASSFNTSTGAITTTDFVLSLDNTKAWNFEFRIIDRLETKTVAISVSQGQPQFFIGADGRVSVGGLPSVEKRSGNLGQLEVYGDVYAKNLRSAGNAWANGNRLAELPITKDMLGSKSVTSDKIDWNTLGSKFISSQDTVVISKSLTKLNSLTLSAGTYILIGDVNYNSMNQATGNANIRFQAGGKDIGTPRYINEVADGAWLHTATIVEPYTTNSNATVTLYAQKEMGKMEIGRRSLVAIRIG